MDLSEKINKLELETAKLEQTITSSLSYTTYFFLASIIAPFIIYFILHNIYAKDNSKENKKKAMKYTLLFTFIIWGSLFGINWYLYK